MYNQDNPRGLDQEISAALRLGCIFTGYYEQEPPRSGSYFKEVIEGIVNKSLTSPPQHVRRL
jgi:hypothetical protein